MTFTKVVISNGHYINDLIPDLELDFQDYLKIIFRFLIGTPTFYTGNEKGREFYERTGFLFLT